MRCELRLNVSASNNLLSEFVSRSGFTSACEYCISSYSNVSYLRTPNSNTVPNSVCLCSLSLCHCMPVCLFSVCLNQSFSASLSLGVSLVVLIHSICVGLPEKHTFQNRLTKVSKLFTWSIRKDVFT